MFLAIFLALLFFCSVALTYMIKACAQRYQFLLDAPTLRSSHSRVTPTGGGLAIAIILLSAVVYLYWQKFLDSNILLALLGGGLPIALVGLWDDFKYLSVRPRLLIQFLAVNWALFCLGVPPLLIFGYNLTHWYWLGYIVSCLSLVWLINLYNFMDGIDGLASTEALFFAIASAVLLLHSTQASMLILILSALAASVAGFLIWNWMPARIFLGDVGSNFMGYLFGVLIILYAQQHAASIWPWVILLGVFIVDATVTLIMRLVQKYPVYQAHRTHVFQKLAQRWGSHQKVVLAITAVNIGWLFPLSWLAYQYPTLATLITLCALAPLVIIALKLKGGEEVI